MPTIQLDRQMFFPGNVVTGSVQQCQSQNVQVMFTAEMFQHWTTTSRRTTGSGKHRRTRTVTHHHRQLTPIANMIIPVDVNSGRFQFQLDFGCVPSLDIEKCRIRYFLKAVDNGVQSLPAPFVILAPMQAAQWGANTSRSETREADVTCCCCCDKGKMTNNFFISKTAIALDRDQPCLQVEVDNTQSEEDCSELRVILNAHGKTKIGHICSFVDIAGSVKVPADVKAGEKKIIQATVPLKPLASPSFSSAVVDIEYFITPTVVMDSAFTSDVSVSFPVYVAHSVDPNSFNFQQHWQTSNFFNPNAGQSSPMMYQPPQQQAQFEMLPPDNFAQGPPLVFDTWNTEGGEEED